MRALEEGSSGEPGGLAATLLLGWLLSGTAPGLAQQGAIGGQVTDAETLQPVAGAQVFVPGTVLGTLTNEEGRYRLEGVPVGQVTVSVQLIGYKEGEQTVSVEAGQITTADFQLEQTALRLQDIVVTGVIGETPRVKLPFVVERLDTGDMPVRTSDVSTLLTGKASGVTVVQGSGQPGAAADILLRGPTSINATGRSQAPLVVIDGVIQSRRGTLADVNALDVDHVEIVKGAAAASIYGARAQNGVIQITTKRGSNLKMNTYDVLLRGEYGVNSMRKLLDRARGHPFAMNQTRTAWITTAGEEFSDLTQVGELTGTRFLECHPALQGTPGSVERFPGIWECPTTSVLQDDLFPGQTWDQVREFFDPGETVLGYAAVTGRFGESSFRASFEEFIEEGVIGCDRCRANLESLNAERTLSGLEPFEIEPRLPEDKGFERQNARLNLDARLGGLDVAASGFHSRSFQDEQALRSGALFGLLLSRPTVDLAVLGEDGYPRPGDNPFTGLGRNPLYLLAISENENRRNRTMGSLDVAWSPARWLRFEGNGSYDRTNFDFSEFRPRNEVFDGTPTLGGLTQHMFADEAVNTSLTASFHQAFLDHDLTVRLKLRYLIEEQDFEQVIASGSRFTVEGVRSFQALEASTFDIDNTIQDVKSQGYMFIGGVDYRGKYILDGLARRDGSSLFGPDERWHWYFRGSAAWRVSQEDFWNIDWWDEMKFRFSYGTAGGRPCFTCQFETFSFAQGVLTPVNLGNAALKPEFTGEIEAGANLVLFDNLGLDVTYAWATTDEQLLAVPQPAFVGFQSRWENAGKVRSRTFEAAARWAPIDAREAGLNFRVSFDRTRQEILELDVPSYKQNGLFWVAPGRPLGEIWGHKWAGSCADIVPLGVDVSACRSQFQVNDDGLLVFTGEGNAFTEGLSNKLWGTKGTVSTPGGLLGDENTFGWGLPVKVWDRDPVCVDQGEKPVEECTITDFLPLGNTTPDFSLSWATNARYKGFSANILLDAVVGFEQRALTLQGSNRRSPIRDQIGKPAGLQKPNQYYDDLFDVGQTNSFWVLDGTFLKLRELALGYTLPAGLLRDAFRGILDRVTMNVTGHNLLTFTDYPGWDPETAFSGGELGTQALDRGDFFGYPNFRTVTVALEMVF